MMDLEQRIRECAYRIWEQEGRIHGRHEEHWYMAKLQLTAEGSMPAIEDSVAAEPVKKSRRAATKQAAPRRRAQATLQ